MHALQLLRCSGRHVGQIAEMLTNELNHPSCRGQLSTCLELFVQNWEAPVAVPALLTACNRVPLSRQLPGYRGIALCRSRESWPCCCTELRVRPCSGIEHVQNKAKPSQKSGVNTMMAGGQLKIMSP